MAILEMETLRVLVKSSDISALGLLKRSSSAKFFEDATRFTKVILKSFIIAVSYTHLTLPTKA